MNNNNFGIAKYNKIFNQFSSNGKMTFYQFIQAMETIISLIYPEDFNID